MKIGLVRSLSASFMAAVFSSAFATSAWANPILTNAGFNANTLPANDDNSTTAVSIGFSVNFFGTTATQLFVNNNGNVTFNSASGTFTPSSLTGSTARPIIAPFFADVDTRNAASGVVHYGTDTVDGHSAFGVNWPNVGYFGSQADKLNNFQLVLIDRSDVGAGDFDIEFNYGQIQWETGSASGGVNGFGGTPAFVGYSGGTGVSGTFAQLAGSGVTMSFEDGKPDALISTSNDGTPGQFLFQVRAGAVVNPPGNGVPLPSAAWSALALLATLGLLGVVRARKIA